MDSKFKVGYSRMTGCTIGNHREYDRGFRNGQQSKQDEVDELKSKVQELWTELDDRQSKDHIIEKCEAIIREILK